AVRVPPLPRPEAPDADDWLSAARTALADADGDTVVVAHSLGCLTALRALAALPQGRRLSGVVLVAGFTEPLPALPELDAFIGDGVDLAAARAHADAWTVLVSSDDPIVPPAATRSLAARLGAELIEAGPVGHFMADDGVTRLPTLLPLLGEAGEAGGGWRDAGGPGTGSSTR
ncbi:RBBP9/YdeN family alpha/beta hydrolase, partial [Mycetocola reblochoni]